MAVYDDQEEKNPLVSEKEHNAVTSPELKHLEGSAPSTATNSAGQGQSKTLSPDGLHGAETKNASGSNSGRGGNFTAGGGGFWKSGSASSSSDGSESAAGDTANKSSGGSGVRGKLAKVKAAVAGGSRRKKLLIGGGVGGGIIALLIFAIGAIVPYELVHIEKNLLRYESKIEQSFEKHEAKKLMNAVAKRLKGKTKAQDEQAANEDEAEGADLAAAADTFDFTNPTIVSNLTKTGITVSYDPTTGEFKGLKNAQGEDITDSIFSSDNFFDQFEQALPEWDVGQIEVFRQTLYDWVQASWKVLPDTENDNAKNDIEETVANGVDEPPSDYTPGEEDENTPPTTEDADANAAAAGGDLAGILKIVYDDQQAGKSYSQILNDVQNSSSLGKDLGSTALVSQAVSELCSVDKSATQSANARTSLIMGFLMRHFTTLISVADQIKSGHVTGQEVNQTMQIFNGDSSAASGSEASLPFSGSSAWQMAADGTTSSSSIPIKSSALPTANSGTGVVTDVNGVLDKIGGAQICAVENSPFGFIANIGLSIGQIALDGFSLGATQIGISAALIGVQAIIQKVVIPDIVNYFTPIGVDGHEDSAQWLNNSAAGGQLTYNVGYGRRIGAASINGTQANTLTAEANNDDTVTDSRLSWTDRTFALSNPDSLVSHLASDLPLGLDNTASGIISYFTHLPATIVHSMATIFALHSALADPSNINPGAAPYGITEYAFTDNEIGKYDPFQNEQYLLSTVSYDGKKPKRIDMLGNPYNYANPDNESDYNDLLHCFVDSPEQLADSTNGANNVFKQFCGAQLNPPGSPYTGYVGGLGTFDCADQGVAVPQNDPGCIDNPAWVPTDTTVVAIYCQYLVGNPADPGCDAAVAPQVNDDVGHFRQYLLDSHIMADYTSLTNSQ